MSKIFVVDNYDSFVFNLVHLLKECGCKDIVVKRNDQFEIDEISTSRLDTHKSERKILDTDAE